MKLTTPAALLLGLVAIGAMLSIAVFMALRGRAHDEPANAIGATSQAPSPPPSALPASAAAAPDTDAVGREVARALDAQRPTLITSCWQPSVKKRAKPEHVDFVLNFTFDSNGKQITRGLTEGTKGADTANSLSLITHPNAPTTSRSDVSMCLAATLTPISVTPPGANVYVEVPFALP